MPTQPPLETPALLLVHGDEPRLVDLEVERWRASRPAAELEVIDAPASLEPLVASLVDMPLFASERSLLVRNLTQLTGGRKGADSEMLVRALAMRAPSTSVCFAVRLTVPATNAVLAAIRDNGGTVIHHPVLRAGDRKQWLDAELRRRALRLPSGGADLLLRCTGGDLGALGTELDKIAAHGAALTLDSLQALAAGTEQLQLYSVLDLLAGPQPARGAALLAELVDEGRSPQYLLSILAGQLRDLLMAHALVLRGQRGANALASSAGMPPWKAERVIRQAQVIPAVLAMAWLHDLHRIDAGLKAGEVEDTVALQHWGLAAAAALGSRRAARTAPVRS
jgi:DNA polymerase III delta subunit